MSDGNTWHERGERDLGDSGRVTDSDVTTGVTAAPGSNSADTGEVRALKPLSGWKVIVPRGGPWGDAVSADLRAQGASPKIAPMINFAPTADTENLQGALERLAAGDYDWLTVTSATTVDVLSSYRAVIPHKTRVAAVGEATATALLAAGYPADIVPHEDNSARGMLAEWNEATQDVVPLRVLTLRSEIAKPVLTEGLKRLGHHVDSVVAYRTVGVPVLPSIVEAVQAGEVRAILVTSGSIAEQVQQQLAPVPESTLVAVIGPQTAKEATRAGLRVDIIAEERTAASLIRALVARAQAIT